MNLFGSGLIAAAALRGRVLELLGAEPEWITGAPDSAVMTWTSGPVTTFFEVQAGASATPDLGELRIVTPVAWVGDTAAALEQCNGLNLHTTTSRWTVAPWQYGPGEEHALQVSCGFVVGPHNQAGLESFVLWCVREQAAIATAKMTNDIADLVEGAPSLFTGAAGGDRRGDWHEVVYHYDRVVTPNNGRPSAGLAEDLRTAFMTLLQEMFDEGTGAWFAAEDSAPLTCEMPFCWERYPDGVIGAVTESGLPTVLVETLHDGHPYVGNGLLITMRLPRGPKDDPLSVVNAMNLLDEGVPGSTHSIGSWFMKGAEATYVVYIPAVLVEQGVDMSLVMREILLTLVRQALLARRLLLSPDELDPEDKSGHLGLSAVGDLGPSPAHGPHGLAWGETGEGRNPAARVLDQIYDNCVGPDTDWSDVREGGFTWWPYHQAQEITATLYGPADVWQGVAIRIATDVRKGVPVTPEVLTVIAAINTELTQSALVLHEDGDLDLACRLFVHEGTDQWAARWAQALAADQFITARELSTRLDGLGDFGEEAISGHPFSGIRPEPDELFGVREVIAQAATEVQAGLTPVVPLLALAGQYAMPHQLSARDDGGLDFSWHPSQTRAHVLVDPAIRVEIRGGGSECGPGWIVRSYAPVAGNATAKARWCNDRNVDEFGVPDGDDHTVIGGWGLTADGECCLTTWLSPYLVPDLAVTAAGLVGNLLRYHQAAVLAALSAAPDVVTGDQLTPEELAIGLESVVEVFGQILEYPPDYQRAVRLEEVGVVVSLTASSEDDVAVVLAEAADGAFRTVLQIPAAHNRVELALLYAALFGHSLSRIPARSQYDLVPGEVPGWNFSAGQLGKALAQLEDEGVLRYDEEDGWVCGTDSAQARFEIERLEMSRLYDSSVLRIAGVLNHPGYQIREGRDIDVLGSWVRRPDGIAYEVNLPPAESAWVGEFMIVEMLAWVGRHVVRHVQEAI